MNSNDSPEKRWIKRHCSIDAFIILAAFTGAAYLRFGEEADVPLRVHWLALLLGAAAFPAVLYGFGLYSTRSASRGAITRVAQVLVGDLLVALLIIAASYVGHFRPLGRGVMVLGFAMVLPPALVHHLWLLRALRRRG